MPIESWFGDLRFAWRHALRRPAFTVLVVVTLALGLGVNSALFAIVDATLFRSLPYRDPSRLVFVWQTLPEHNVFELEATPFDYQEWGRRARSFSALALIATDSFTLTGDGEAERVRGARVTSTLMPLVGVAPRLGRAFVEAEDSDAAAPTAILGDGIWRRRFGADPAIVGRTIRIDGTPCTVIGVMAPGVTLPAHLAGSDELWLPARMTAAERTNAVSHNYTVIGRLADGVSLSAASAEIVTLAATLAAEQRASHGALGARLVDVRERTVREVKPALIILLGGVALLLLIACANVSTLLIVRAAGRSRESAVRAALGATRGRLWSLAMAEGLVLATLGGSAGVVLGTWMLNALLPRLTDVLPRAVVIGSVNNSARVVSLTMIASLAIGAILGAVVAMQRHPAGLADALKAGSRTIGTRRAGRTRTALVVSQIAFASVLLVTAGLMISSIIRLSRVRPGFDPEQVLTFRLALPDTRYSSGPARVALVDELMRRLGATPGIAAAALNSRIPFGGSRGADGIAIEGRPAAPGEVQIADQRYVTPDYFKVLRIPIVDGRRFSDRDDAQSEPVAIVNRAMARRFWSEGDPLHARVRITGGPSGGSWIRIVGIVDDVRHVALSRPPVPEMYRPYSQIAVADFTVTVKTAGEPAAAARACRAAVAAIDADLPLYDVRTMEDRIRGSIAQLRTTMLLLVVTAALAAGLAAIAIYGSIWYSVAERIPEIGIRLALGAAPSSVFRAIVVRALGLTGVGIALGAIATSAAGPMLRALLFETPVVDPMTYAAVALALAGAAAVASIAPARRAMRIDPMIALRSD